MRKRKQISVIVCMILVLLIAMSGNASAASAKWKEASKAYATYLRKNQSSYVMNYTDMALRNPENNNTIYSFMLVDLDKNGVPELLGIHYENARYAYLYVFAYKSGKVSKVKTVDMISTAQGRYNSYICKMRHLHVDYEGGFVGYKKSVYKYKSGKISLYASKNYEAIPGRTTIRVNGKKASAKAFQAAVKKCKKDAGYTYRRNTSSNRKKYLGYTGSASTVAVSSVSLNKNSVSMIKGKTITLTAKISPANATKKTVTWSSSNTSVATVSGGVVKAVKAGSAVITVKSNNGKAAKCTVTVRNPVNPSVSIGKSISSGNKTGRLIAYTEPSNASVRWSSSNSNIVSVDEHGNVTAKGAGSAVITAKITYNGVTYSNQYTLSTYSKASYGAWSDWTTDPISETENRKVESQTLYRYYCFYCPQCGGREPFQGNSDCRRYTLTLDNGIVKWSTVPYSQSNPKTYSYTPYKYYTESLGDGLRWNFSSGNLNHTAVGTKDAAGPPADVIVRGYRSRSVSYSYYFY